MKKTMLNTISLDSVDSTNTYLRNLPPGDNEDWTLVTACYQEAGRGAGRNRWESEAGKNLLFSLRTHPVFVEAPDVFVLSASLALSVWHALQNYIQGFSIKWPNDIYYGDRKIAGLLIENNLMGGRVQSSRNFRKSSILLRECRNTSSSAMPLVRKRLRMLTEEPPVMTATG